MPMIDIYAKSGTFMDKQALVQSIAELVMRVEKVPNISMFRQNTVAFLHESPDMTISNVDGDSDYIRAQVLTNKDALNREQQIELTKELTELLAAYSGNTERLEKISIILTEATAGGWGLWGKAHENSDLILAAREELSHESNQ